jgi:hypothetical protein
VCVIVFKSLVLTAKKTQRFSSIKINSLMPFRKVFIVYSENHKKRINNSVSKVRCYRMLKQVVHTVTTGFKVLNFILCV